MIAPFPWVEGNRLIEVLLRQIGPVFVAKDLPCPVKVFGVLRMEFDEEEILLEGLFALIVLVIEPGYSLAEFGFGDIFAFDAQAAHALKFPQSLFSPVLRQKGLTQVIVGFGVFGVLFYRRLTRNFGI
jgi:hypothetical protein